jgi:arginine decarboxylase
LIKQDGKPLPDGPSVTFQGPAGDLARPQYRFRPRGECGKMVSGRTVVSATFVTPYPPGFPILVPGQVVTDDILLYMKALDVKEIHGYEAEYGLLVFRPEALERVDAGALLRT